MAQPEAVRRLADFPIRTPECGFPAQAPDVNVRFRIGNGLRRKELESGLQRRRSEQTIGHPFGTRRYEADPHIDELVATAVEAVLDRTLIHAPEGVLESLDPAPDGCEGHGEYPLSSSIFRADRRNRSMSASGPCLAMYASEILYPRK